MTRSGELTRRDVFDHKVEVVQTVAEHRRRLSAVDVGGILSAHSRLTSLENGSTILVRRSPISPMNRGQALSLAARLIKAANAVDSKGPTVLDYLAVIE